MNLLRNLLFGTGILLLLTGTVWNAFAAVPENPDEDTWFLPPDGYSFPRKSRMVMLEKRIPFEQLPEVCRKYVAPAMQKDGTRIQVLFADLTGNHRDDLILNTGLGGKAGQNYAVFRMAGGDEQYVLVNASISGRLRLLEEQEGWLQLEMVTGNADQKLRTLYAYSARTGQYEIVRQELHDYQKCTCTVKKGGDREPFEVDRFAVEFERRLHRLAQNSPQLEESGLSSEKLKNGFYRFDYRTAGKQGRAQEGFTILLSAKGKWKRKIYASCELSTEKLYGIRPGKALYFHVIYTRNRGYKEMLDPLIRPNYNFYVINRNRADDQLSLRITVDDQLIAAKTMKRDTGWFSPDYLNYPVRLKEGEHTLTIQAGSLRYEGKILVDDQHDVGVAEVRLASSFNVFEKGKNGITFASRKGPFEP